MPNWASLKVRAISAMDIKSVRKAGIWIIAGVTLMVLLALNVSGEVQLTETVAIVALAVLVGWIVAMALWSRLSR